MVCRVTRPVSSTVVCNIKKPSPPVSAEPAGVSPADLAFDAIQIKKQTKGKNTQHYIEAREGNKRGNFEKINVGVFSKNDFYDLEDIIDFEEVIRRIQVTFDQELERQG